MGSFPHRPYGLDHREVPLAEWPSHDRVAWTKALRPATFLAPVSPAAAWAPATQRRVARSYGRFLGWLTLTGRLDAQAGPASRLTQAMFEDFVPHLLPINKPRSVISVLDGLVMFIRALGLANDTAWLRSVQQGLWPEVRDTRDKAQRLRHALALLELGATLMRGAPLAGTRLSHALRYRDGLIIALLAMRPLRTRNFLGLVIGQHLVQQDGRWWILIAASETKNKRPIEVRFPAKLVGFLEHYLATVRPLLARGHGAKAGAPAHLWLGKSGVVLSERRFHSCVCGRTKTAFGRSVNPHLFRDAVATSIALDDPEHVRSAASVLGHASFASTERHYRMSRGADATRVLNEVMEALESDEHE